MAGKLFQFVPFEEARLDAFTSEAIEADREKRGIDTSHRTTLPERKPAPLLPWELKSRPIPEPITLE